MEILGTRYIKVRYTQEEIIKQFTTSSCTHWVELEFDDDDIELGCECGHCDALRVCLVDYIKAQKKSC